MIFFKIWNIFFSFEYAEAATTKTLFTKILLKIFKLTK